MLLRGIKRREQKTYRLRLWNDKEKEDNLEVLYTTDKTYRVDKKIDYFTVRSMVIRSLENIAREELDRHVASINLHKIVIQPEDEDIIANTSNNLFDDQDDDNKNYQHH